MGNGLKEFGLSFSQLNIIVFSEKNLKEICLTKIFPLILSWNLFSLPSIIGAYLKFKYMFKTSMNTWRILLKYSIFMPEVTNCGKSHLDNYWKLHKSIPNEFQDLTHVSLYGRKHRIHPVWTIKKIDIKSYFDIFYHAVLLVCWGFLP